jgi:uncharacterized protein YecE (DUF72 family)
MTIRIGTSGWNYPSGRGTWNGVFYPTKRGRGFDELSYYAERFDTVEVNSTFYRMPDAGMARRWLERTPADFLFSVKLYQKFTHPDMYLARDGVSEWNLSRGDFDQFRQGIEPLVGAGRLAAVLLQFPPSFHAEAETRDYLDWLLDALDDYPLAVELRHRTWSDESGATDARLAAHRATWVLIDEPKFRDSVKQSIGFRGSDVLGFGGSRTPAPQNLSTPAPQHPGTPAPRHPSTPEPQNPRTPEPESALVYLRLHGRNAEAWWDHDEMEDRYDYWYSRAELAPFARMAARASSSGRRVLMYMNNHFSAKAVANAAVLKYEVGQPVPGEYPREMIDRYPELTGIVATSGLPL